MVQPRSVIPCMLCLLALTGIAVFPCLALNPAQPASSYLRTNFTTEDGLPSNIVNFVLQTRNGFLWVGTADGLARFDGRHFTVMRFAPEIPIAGLTRALAEAPDGALWVGTNKGVLRIPGNYLDQAGVVPATVYHSGSGLSDSIFCLHFSRDGVLWAGTRQGLYRLDRDSFSQVIPSLPISTIEEAANGRLLVVTSKGLVELDGGRIVQQSGFSTRLGVPDDKVFDVFEDHKGVRWFCTGGGVAREIGSSIQKLQPFGIPHGPQVFRGMEDPQGNVWLSLSTGLYRVTGAGLEPVPGATATFIAADLDGNLWVGTNGEGLVRFKNRDIHLLTTDAGLPNKLAQTVLVTSDGTVWVGNNCGGLSWFDGRRFHTLAEKDGLLNSCVWALAEDHNKDLWVGTYGGGIFRLHDGRFKQFSKPEGLLSDAVKAIFVARDDSLWIATRDGLSHMQDGRFRNFTKADGLSNNSIQTVNQDAQGVIWVATSSGVDHMIGDRFISMSIPARVQAYRILGEVAGNFYALAAPQGTFRVGADRLVSVTSEPSTFSMIHAKEDLWFCASVISRASKDSFLQWEHELNVPRDYSRFGREDGLPPAECTAGTPDMAAASDGKVWIATSQGLAVFDLPPAAGANPGKPAIYMEQVTIGRTVQSPGHELVLPPGTYHAELQFDAIELRSPEKIHFQYRMDGVDPGWLDSNAAGTAVYNSFPQGAHQFHVRACNRDGIWDREGFVYNITQQPFFYETNLFRFAVFATVLLLIAAAYQYRLRQVTARMNAQLDARVEERTRMARELHDTLLQTIQVSKMVADHAWVGYRDDTADPRTGALEKLSGWLARALEEARASLQSLRSSTSDTKNLANALRDAGAECVLDRGIEFDLSVQGTAKDMHPIVRDEVYRIGYEAIRNACHHSAGSRVEVHLEYANDLLLRVRDDGRGVDPEVAAKGKPGHFGLKGMQERAARIGGKLVLASSPASGTQVELTVPGRLIFQDTRPRWRTILSKYRRRTSSRKAS